MVFEKISVWLFTVELNLLLWLATLGLVLAAEVEGWARWSAMAGFVFAALWQHQAFYRRKRERARGPASEARP